MVVEPAHARLEQARWACPEATCESALECVGVRKADGKRDALQGLLALRKTTAGLVQAQRFHELGRRLTEDAFERFAEMAGTNAGATRERFHGEIGMQIAHDPTDEIGEAIGRDVVGAGERGGGGPLVRRGGQ